MLTAARLGIQDLASGWRLALAMVILVALPFQVADMTGSFVAVGLIGLAELVPLIAFGLWGGAMADAVDRRRVVLITELAFMVLSETLLLKARLVDTHLADIVAAAVTLAHHHIVQRRAPLVRQNVRGRVRIALDVRRAAHHKRRRQVDLPAPT